MEDYDVDKLLKEYGFDEDKLMIEARQDNDSLAAKIQAELDMQEYFKLEEEEEDETL